jgi:hypothetical protein
LFQQKETIMTLTLKTSGAAPENGSQFDQKKVADAIAYEISGGGATLTQASNVTQQFVDRHGIKAVYHSGTFMNFKIGDSALDEFETFAK